MNGVFALYKRNKTEELELSSQKFYYIFIRNDSLSLNTYYFLKETNPPRDALQGYTCYTYENNGKFHNDCFSFSESVIAGRELDYQGEDCPLHEEMSSLIFGDTKKQNDIIRKNLIKNNPEIINEYANPHVSEAYLIIDKGDVYHSAPVLFEDGSDRITLEANAAYEHLKKPQFNMYSVSKFENTFHERNKKDYGPSPVTFVLKLKPTKRNANRIQYVPNANRIHYIPNANSNEPNAKRTRRGGARKTMRRTNTKHHSRKRK